MVNWILTELENDNFLDLVFGFFKKKNCILFFPNENQLGFHEVSFISALGMVSSESCKRLHSN